MPTHSYPALHTDTHTRAHTSTAYQRRPSQEPLHAHTAVYTTRMSVRPAYLSSQQSIDKRHDCCVYLIGVPHTQ